jgi:hypothetical protein
LAVGVVLAAMTACGSGTESRSGPATTEAAAPTPTLGTAAPGGEALKAAARWETITTRSGTGATQTPTFEVLPAAIQWRARYSCETGALKVNTDPPPRRPAALVDAACPSEGVGYSITTGAVRLIVEATGPWRLIIDQQVDTPLNEPPLPTMATARVLRQGNFYDVEKQNKGTARIYQLADGRRALRMEDFEVNQNTDLFVWLSAASSPKTSEAAVSADYWELGNLKSTIGNQNYEIPAHVPLERVRSVVIWCQPVAIAYGAAALT